MKIAGLAILIAILVGACGIRLATAWITLGYGLRDREGLRSLALLPLRDCVGLATWAFAFVQPTVIWRGTQFRLTRGGRMVAVGESS